MQGFFSELQATLGPLWPVLIFVLILIVGYIVARFIERLVRAGLRRTSLDDRLASQLPGERAEVSSEQIGGRIAFWVVIVLVFIVAFDAVDLGAVSGPLGVFVERVLGFIPNLIGAALLAVVAYVIATVLRMFTTKALQAANVDERIRRAGRDEIDPAADQSTADVVQASGPAAPAAGKTSFAKTLGDAVFYFVLLLFLPAVLGALELEGILAPIQGLINEILAFLPNLLLAAVILVVGWFVAKVIRNLVTNLLAAAGADRLSDRIGLSRATGSTRLSDLIGLVVYILVLVPVIVAALNALQVEAVTRPASAMLAQFLEAVPRIFVAVLILGIAYVVGRLVASLVTNVLTGVGFNRLFEGLGFTAARTEAAAPEAPGKAVGPMALDTRTPAGIVGIVVLVGVMLFAATEAADALGLGALAVLIAEFTVLAGRILLGLAIFAVGLYLANLAYTAVHQSGTSQAAVLAVAARVSILVLAAAMGLRQMGLADSIINLAFGLTLGAIAVAAALAFGLGGREAAREQLERLRAQAEAGRLDAPDALKPGREAPGAAPATRPGSSGETPPA